MAQKDNLPVNTEAAVVDGGSITYANEVIAIISGIAASEIEGIAGMVTAGGLGEIISKNRNITRGVKVEVGSEEVSVDLYTIVEYGQPIQKVAAEVQENVRKSIESMTGLRVVRVDIHVQGVSFEKDKQDAQNRLEAANIRHLATPQDNKKGKKAEKDTKKEEKKPEEAEEVKAEDTNSKPQTEQTTADQPADSKVEEGNDAKETNSVDPAKQEAKPAPKQNATQKKAQRPRRKA